MPYAPNCYSIFRKIYDLLQLHFKTHSVLLRRAFRAGPLDSFGNCVKRRQVPHPHRIGLPLLGWPLPNTIYTRNQSARGNCGGWRGTELISRIAELPRGKREILWVPQEINPLWGSRITGPEQDCCDGCKIGLHPLSHQFTPVSCLFRPCQSFYKLS